jgi:hypothetical protein
MVDISQEQAYIRAYHLKKHQKKLEEIKKGSNTVDNHLSSRFHSIPKRQGFKGIWWSEKVNRENRILLDKLIKIKEREKSVLKPLSEIKSLKPKDFNQDNELLFRRISNVNASLSTKNILKQYSKYKQYSNLRSKILKKKIDSFKKLEKSKLILLKEPKSLVFYLTSSQDHI